MSRRKIIPSAALQPMQCRMARVALGWTLDELAAASGVGRRAILRFEQSQSRLHARNAAMVRQALETAGIRFIDEGEFAGGVAPPEK
jgi:transcriptional regulator with XRE-family HTH domain